MRVIITGGSGLIGQAVTGRLIRQGHEVIILSRAPERLTQLPGAARAVKWDGRSAQGWGDLANGAGAIINLAGESVAGDSLLALRWTEERKQRIRQSRLDSGQAVNEAVRLSERKPLVVVQASAVGYYGPSPAPRVEEEAAPGEDFLASVCQDWEASTQEEEALGIRRVVFRIGIVLSRRGGALPRQALPFRWFAGGPIGNGKQGYPWIHIADVSEAICRAVEDPELKGIYNLCAPNPVSNARFGKALAKVLRRPYWLPAPGFAFRLAFGEAATILLDGQMAYPARLLAAGHKFLYPHLEAALADVLKNS